MKRSSSRQRTRFVAWLAAAYVALASLPALAQGNGERVQQELLRTDEAVESASVVVREGDSIRAREILELAQRVQRDAWDNFRSSRVLVAGRLTLEARGMAARAISMAREDRNVRERAQREMDRAGQAIARARERIEADPSPEGPRLVDEATALLSRAQATFGERHFLAAMRLALAAQRLAAQAAALGAPGGARGLSRDLERTDHLLERVQSLVSESGDAPAAKLFEQARSMQDAAWAAFREGRSREAHARTREARALANRVRVQLGGIDDPASAPAVLEETQAMIDRAVDIVGPSGDEHARALLDRAGEHQSRAHASLDAGDVRRALAQTRVARQLAKRALQLTSEGGAD